ncbi:HNH endonuclease, partial [Acidaminobacter sp. JC074]|nr:HNH endonuclease [Acidaminobacter sp. JC074]
MVFVLNKNKTPLNPCHPAKARWLLNKGYAVVHKREPFTIRLKQLIVDPETKDY